MAAIQDYVTVEEASADERVPYTAYWIRKLAREGTVKATKIGPSKHRGQWLIHLPSLLSYIEEMKEMGTKKHSPR